MRRIYGARGCAVLYNTLRANSVSGKVLMPANICETVPAVYMILGMEPVFCDISREDWQMDRQAAAEMLEESSFAVLHYNHTYGYIGKEDELFLREIKNRYPELFVIDDRCLCFPELNMTQSPADLVLYSTGFVKYLDLGWGGFGYLAEGVQYSEYALAYREADLDEFDRHIKNCHRENRKADPRVMTSFWLDTACERENYFEEIDDKIHEATEHREAINRIYARIPGSMKPGYHNWRYQLLLENTRECHDLLYQHHLFCSNHYKSLGEGYFTEAVTPNCDYLESHVLNLFNDFRYTLKQAEETAALLEKAAMPVSQ